jgi:hypothetical protein
MAKVFVIAVIIDFVSELIELPLIGPHEFALLLVSVGLVSLLVEGRNEAIAQRPNYLDKLGRSAEQRAYYAKSRR